ncbi:MAG: histidine phosphatase family protein [Burkholderiaceae bacterium]
MTKIVERNGLSVAARQLVFITHPNVVISADVPVPRWPLSDRGRARMRLGLSQPWVSDVRAVYCSDEQKAIDGADILAGHLGLPVTRVAALGENDRSATGFLPPAEFEQMADAFFAQPEGSVRGWERAIDAQRRIVGAVNAIAVSDTGEGTIAIVSHGAVGTLLYCHLAQEPINRRRDQPANGGGNYYRFTMAPPQVRGWWQAIDAGDEHNTTR